MKQVSKLFCLSPQVTLSVFQLASAAGLTCDIDPALVTSISSMQTGSTSNISATSTDSKGLKA